MAMHDWEKKATRTEESASKETGSALLGEKE